MQINDTIFNVELLDIINELRVQLLFNGVSLFAKSFDSGDDVMVCCPYHKEGQERRPSAGIRKSDGLFHCLACGKTVALDEMISNCFGYDDPIWGYRWLLKNFATVQVESRQPIKLEFNRGKEVEKVEQTYVSEEELDNYRYSHKYMYERGLTDDVIDLFDIGYDKDTDSITFPVRQWRGEHFGEAMFVARRQVKTKRFDLPKDMQKPLYGLYEVWDTFGRMAVSHGVKRLDSIYVCEGLFDCLRLWCNGKCAVAGFGCLFSEYQIELLDRLPTRTLILALDNDEAGRKATKKLKDRIKGKLVKQVILPEGRKDIGECTDDELQNLKEVF